MTYSHAIPLSGCRSPGVPTFAWVASVVFVRPAQVLTVLGAQDGPAVGDLVCGRIVPLPAGACFATPPVPVDRLTARRIGRAVLRSAPTAERLRAVASYQRRASA